MLRIGRMRSVLGQSPVTLLHRLLLGWCSPNLLGFCILITGSPRVMEFLFQHFLRLC